MLSKVYTKIFRRYKGLRGIFVLSQAADASRERKKRLTTQGDTLRFEKTLEIAQKQLKETQHMQEIEQRQERILTGLYREGSGDRNSDSGGSVVNSPKSSAPLTEVTQKLTNALAKGTVVEADGMKARSMSPHGSPQRTAKIAKPIIKAQSPVEENPPSKPPRTMEYQSPEARSPVKSPVKVITKRMSPQRQSAPLPHPGLNRLSGALPETPGRPPLNMPPPPATSTPKPDGPHVTFSSAITEIKGTPVVGVTKKRVPPPPPPRNSSRTPGGRSSASPSPTPQTMMRAASPHTYENIENYPDQSVPQSPSKKDKVGRLPSPVKAKPASPTKGKPPLNKFQKEIAAGIYSNMNRPDLQEQRVNPAVVVRDASLSDGGSRDQSSDSDGSNTTDTIKRKPKLNGKVNGNHKPAVAPKGPRKIPPPPPQRKTSALTKGTEGGEDKKLTLHQQYTKLQETPSKGAPQSTGIPKLTNGDVRQRTSPDSKLPTPTTPVSPSQSYEETDIY